MQLGLQKAAAKHLSPSYVTAQWRGRSYGAACQALADAALILRLLLW
jgi:hypothetical protein